MAGDSPVDRTLMECILADVSELARLGLVALDAEQGLTLTDKGNEIADRAEGWVWS